MDKLLLHTFGERVRAARERAGMTVVELARRAGLSRRFLTETEAGRANPSLLRLAQLAEALELTLSQLLDLGGALPRSERIALVGLRGAGKSTVGRALARELEVPFVELDQRVEEPSGLQLAEIFSLHGEEHFHRLEAEALEQVLAEGDRFVVACGGSIVAAPRTFERLRATCRTVWLKASPEAHFGRVAAQGDPRPMRHRPRAMEELRGILARREPLYARCALAVETTDRTVEEVAEEVLAWHAAATG